MATMHKYCNFIEQLPDALLQHVLSYLDGKTLLTSCSVSKSWNKIISASSKAWWNASQYMSITINQEHSAKTCEQWKSFVRRMLGREHQMGISACFEVRCLKEVPTPIKTIHYHKGKLATASDTDKKIRIWDYSTEECVRKVKYSSWITSVKFDDRIIIGAFELGEIETWDISSGVRLGRYHSIDEGISCFDYLTDADLIVAGFQNHFIRVWNMSSSSILKETCINSSELAKVILRPYPGEEHNVKEDTLLLSMDKEAIFVSKLNFRRDKSSPEGNTPEYLTVATLDCISLKHPNFTYKQPCRNFRTPSLLFDGEFIYFPVHSHDGDSGVLCKYDLINKCMVSKSNLEVKVKAVLGIGKKFMVIISSQGPVECLNVMDIKTNKTITSFPVPQIIRRFHTSCFDLVCLCGTSWLDGFDGRNDLGVLYASVVADFKSIHTLKWTLGENDTN